MKSDSITDVPRGSRNWLLHARYVRGEHGACLALADELQRAALNNHAYAHFVKGSVLADAGRHQEALERFHSCIRLQPQHIEALKLVAKCLFHQGRYHLSIEAYLEADKLTKQPDPEIYCALAECAWQQGDLESGTQWARGAARAGGGERASALLAKLLLSAGDTQGAVAAYDDALNADTLAAAGALQLRAGDARRAFQLLGAALAARPAHAPAALALAAMLLGHRDLDAALARLRAALAARPACVAAHSNLGLALMAKKKYVAALTCLQRAVCRAPLCAPGAHNAGLVLLVCRRPASAFCRLAAAAALQPTQPYTVLLLGVALERLGDSRSDAAYSRAAELAPENALIRLNLAGRHARAGRLEEAAQEAAVCAGFLQVEDRPDHQLANALASLLTLLRDSGVELPLLTDIEVPDLPAAEDAPITPEEQMTADEV